MRLLPPGATATHEQAKKLQKAFSIVGVELGRRGSALARANESTGAVLPIRVCGGTVSLPAKCLKLILDGVEILVLDEADVPSPVTPDALKAGVSYRPYGVSKSVCLIHPL